MSPRCLQQVLAVPSLCHRQCLRAAVLQMAWAPATAPREKSVRVLNVAATNRNGEAGLGEVRQHGCVVVRNCMFVEHDTQA